MLRIIGRVRRTPLFLAVTLAVLLGMALAYGAFWTLGKLVGTKADEPPAPLEVGRTALTLVAGIGGAVALVVAYRRQRDIEQGRFIERFGAAATQLGDPDVAVRIAGVYAMATTADEGSNLARRQQCIDVLCGYLRLGFDPDQGNSNRTELVVKLKRGAAPGIEGSEEDTHFRFRQNDRVVRDTIVRVIAAHLLPSADVDWTRNDFDFTGAYFGDAPFKNALFAGRRISFTSAIFAEGETSFECANFDGDASFEKAQFLCPSTTFERVRFDGKVSFAESHFNSSGHTPIFENAIFNATVNFRDARFTSILPMFEYATFNGEYTFFSGTKFTNWTTFNGALFSGKYASFEEAEFPVGAEFNGVDFENEQTTFDGAVFGGDHTSFYQSNFGSGRMTFRETKFLSGSVSFNEPNAWRGMRFDWDAEGVDMPPCISPREWPPTVTPLPRLKLRRRIWTKVEKIIGRRPNTRKPY